MFWKFFLSFLRVWFLYLNAGFIPGFQHYECTKRRHNGKGSENEGSCNISAVPAREMDDLILKQIKHIAMDKEMLEEALAQASETASKEVKKLHKEKEKLEGMLKEAESRKDRFMKMVGDGIFENAGEEEKVEMHKEFKKAMADMKEIEANIMNIEFQLADEETRVFNAEIMHETLYRFTELWNRATDEEKKDLMKLIVHKVTYTPEEVTYSLYETPSKTKLLDTDIAEELNEMVRCNVNYDSRELTINKTEKFVTFRVLINQSHNLKGNHISPIECRFPNLTADQFRCTKKTVISFAISVLLTTVLKARFNSTKSVFFRPCR